MKRKRKRDRNIGGVDRISELPEGIIHGIMSHLTSKEVAQTCVLSKKWYTFKRNYPVLDFKLPCARTKENFDYLMKIRQAVYDSLNHFSSNKLALQTFSLDRVILGQPNLLSDLDCWIKLALENGVNELHLCAEVRGHSIIARRTTSFYILPQPVFCSKTLTILELTSCVLDLPISMFSSLRKLTLSACVLKGSISLKDTDCPVLEEMSVLLCLGEDFKSIHISGLLRLHTVVFSARKYWYYEFISVEILSQSIQSLALLFDYHCSWSDINIYSCDRLKSLYLGSTTVTDAELHSLLLNFPLLEELYLFNCRNLKMIKISSPQLKTLEICYHNIDYSCKLIEVSAPNLENFIYKSITWEKSSGNSVIEVADCCRSLKTLVLYGHLSADEVFHDLISRFPLLENIWIIGCNFLRNIMVPNLQLKRLYIVSCSGLKAVEVTSPELCEFYCSSRKLPDSSVADAVCASGVRCKRSSISLCFLRLKEMLKSFAHVKDEFIFNRIVDVGL